MKQNKAKWSEGSRWLLAQLLITLGAVAAVLILKTAGGTVWKTLQERFSEQISSQNSLTDTEDAQYVSV